LDQKFFFLEAHCNIAEGAGEPVEDLGMLVVGMQGGNQVFLKAMLV
jgi:hypothetical protein